MAPVRERRSSPRINVRLQVVETHEDSTYFQRTGNLSAGGLFLEGTMPHPPGTKVRLGFHLPNDERPVEVTGEITAPGKDEGLGMGVRFLDLSPDDRGRIERFLDESVGQPPGR
ncbi:MAG: TIGR02266 family protein [Deltaproteobacteria bacterium]|nr:TIGR02266 family protein [Deltaproteobacteria bacterium]